MIRKLHIRPEIDETGHQEEMTWDLWPLIPATQTHHLNEDGLPKVGTILSSGMILLGKIGKTRYFAPSCLPTALEKHALSFHELRRRYGHMWKDGSLRVTPETSGMVIASYIIKEQHEITAVIEIDSSPTRE